MIDSNDSVTAPARRRNDDRTVSVPSLTMVGSGDTVRPARQRLMTFTNRLIIGRRPRSNEENTISLTLSDPRVSSTHAEIDGAEGNYMLRDLHSTNGTFVDGRPIPDAGIALRPGSVVFFGGQVAVFRMLTIGDCSALQNEMADPVGPTLSVSPIIAGINHLVRRLAPSDAGILLFGETGVGKDIYAQAIHRLSGRKGPFVALNCAALPRELVESELFGYARGAHSMAAMSKPGLLETADGGTLFLDEVGEMAPELQAKLLRFLEDGFVVPLGSVRRNRVDVRVVAATNRSSSGWDGSVGVRPDLAARLGAHPITLPPLRERIEDLRELVAYFMDKEMKPIESTAFQAMCLHTWPGNIRELRLLVQQAKLLARDSEVINQEHLPAPLTEKIVLSSYRSVPSEKGTRESGELRSETNPARTRPPPTAAQLEELLQRFQGNMLRIARELDRKPQLVYRWAKRFGLSPQSFRDSDS